MWKHEREPNSWWEGSAKAQETSLSSPPTLLRRVASRLAGEETLGAVGADPARVPHSQRHPLERRFSAPLDFFRRRKSSRRRSAIRAWPCSDQKYRPCARSISRRNLQRAATARSRKRVDACLIRRIPLSEPKLEIFRIRDSSSYRLMDFPTRAKGRPREQGHLRSRSSDNVFRKRWKGDIPLFA